MNIRNRKKFRNPQSAIRNRDRRGILLLVVLSMLTLFLLVGTAFIVTANHYRRTNKALARATEAANSSIKTGDLLTEVINQLVRDTNNQYSSLRFHSLLRDLYGSDGLEIGPGTTPTVRFAAHSGFTYTYRNALGNNVTVNQASLNDAMLTTGNQFFWVAVEIFVPAAPLLPPISTIDNYYNGRLMSFHDGDLAGATARVIDYVYRVDINVPDRAVAVFTLLPLIADGPIVSSNLSLDDTHTALINGQPFNGTGVGYNLAAATGARLTAGETLLHNDVPNYQPLALLPHATFFDARNVNPQAYLPNVTITGMTQAEIWNNDLNNAERTAITQLAFAGHGGSDESYDAVDFQNMALALMPVNPEETILTGQAGSWPNTPTGWPLPSLPTDLGNIVLPSLHRPALLNYWSSQVATFESDPNLLRKTMLRPSWFDHPSFTGSNPDLSDIVRNFSVALEADDTDDIELYSDQLLARMTYGPWDVDNDNDGIRDSVWVDFGAPVMARPDGTLVKPLAALLVLDLDGRLNVNAHGSREHANGNDPIPPQNLAGGILSNQLPAGAGYGTADISLNSIFGTQPIQLSLPSGRHDTTSLGLIFQGHPEMPGRYGWDGPFAQPPFRAPGLRQKKDLLAQLDLQGLPQYAAPPEDFTGILPRSAYGSPPDLLGRYALGLNDFGQPVHEAINLKHAQGIRADVIELDEDTPYELNLSLFGPRGENQNSVDTPYSLGELERLLRAYDVDALALPQRLWELGKGTALTTPAPDDVNKWRALLTTDSYDLPVPNVQVPQWMVEIGRDGTANNGDEYAVVMNQPATNATFSDLVEYSVRAQQNPPWPRTDDAANPTRRPQIQQWVRELLPRDLANGLRLDINRPFGNGRDDNNNGVVDEPGEWVDANTDGIVDVDERDAYWAIDSSRATVDVFPVDSPANDFDANGRNRPGTTGIIRDDVDRDGDGDIEPPERGDTNGNGQIEGSELVALHNYRRQLLAKDLYVLAMTLVDPLPRSISPTQAEREAEEKRAERLAQWAINVVDFRDADNCQTPFEYDVNPFDGWQADGNLSTANDIYGLDNKYTPPTTTAQEPGGLVWGAESPELLITETLAWHDRKAEDGNNEVSPGNIEDASQVGPDDEDDSDFDQEVRPQGVGFIELYNPRPANLAASADTHAIAGFSTRPGGLPEDDWDNDGQPDNAGADMGVNLAAVVESATGNTPVWRIAVYKTANIDDPEEIGGPHKDPDAVDPDRRAKGMDRSIYFAGDDPGYDDDGVAYFNNATRLVPSVRPGGYLVVGAGESQGGGNQFLAPFGAKTGQLNETSRGVMLDTTPGALQAVAVMGSDDLALPDADGFLNDAPADLCAVAVIDQPVGFSFSEPPGGYILKGGTQYSGAIALDVPLDDQRFKGGGGIGLGGGPANDLFNADGETRLKLPTEAAGGGLGGAAGGVPAENARRTIPGFSWVYLQRLANPLLSWNPPPRLPDGLVNPQHNVNRPVNPYVTIDSMGVNVTVFNGLAPDENRKVTVDGAIEIVEYDNDQAVDAFASLQRGRFNGQQVAVTDPSKIDALVNLQTRALSDNRGQSLPSEPDANPTTKANLWASAEIGLVGTEKRGFVFNRAGMDRSGVQPKGNIYNFKGVPDCTLGFLNEPFRQLGSSNKVVPEQPFPWRAWNNRPYVSANELLQVPAFRSSQMLQAFSFNNTATPRENFDAQDRVAVHELSNDSELETDGPYGDLLNFFRTERYDPDTPPANPTNDKGIAGLYRVLDYLQVPSKFVGTQTWLSPAAFGRELATIGATPNLDPNDPRHLLQPPFNRVSAYRDPGRVNLNTIADNNVWLGVLGAVDTDNNGTVDRWHVGPNANELSDSRRGYGPANSAGLLLAPDTPTFFENPFRSPDAIDFVPIDDMRKDAAGKPRGAIQATLLRQDEFSTALNKPPLFAAETTDDPGTPNIVENSYRDSNRNAYFRYQPMTRLDNLTTTRSNVYAVWVTIGFFEVEEAPSWDNNDPFPTPTSSKNVQDFFPTRDLYDRVYPEGFMLGKEAGIDTGDVERLREFAVVDRTIPVAFEPGANHNVDRAIPLRRRIE